jgi:hypothetical protein
MVTERACFRCFFCGNRFPSDLELGKGTFVPEWKVAACFGCVLANREGISPKHPAMARLVRAATLDSGKSGTLIEWPPAVHHFLQANEAGKRLNESRSQRLP